jgi:Pvc16 N-terminal domain
MSNSLAIATVTEAFRQQIQKALTDSESEIGISGALAKVLRPSATTSGHPTGESSVYAGLYLYQVVPNTAWRNDFSPVRRNDGSTVRGTRTAYDLFYLITCYGDESQMESQRILGAVVRKMTSEPVLTTEMIKNAKTGALVKSNLETEVERVKFSQLPLSLEELSKLWSVFFQTTYCLSVAFQASVVFIDGTESGGPSLPVLARNVYVRPFRQIMVEKILSQESLSDPVLDQPILFGQTLVLQGKQLQGDVTRVRIGGIEVTPLEVSDQEIKVTLDSPPFPVDSLFSGVMALQIIQDIDMGTPEIAHKGFESDVYPLVLRPAVTPSVSGKTVDGSYRKAKITLNFVPSVAVGQRVALLLNELNPPPSRPPHAYRFDVTVPSTPPPAFTTLEIDVRVLPAQYLVRVQLDGAESMLDAGPDPENAPHYVGPKVNMT